MHDGKQFTSKDVKYTFDRVSTQTPAAPAKLRLNTRREVVRERGGGDAVDPRTVVFR